jgi:hypothetical protein
MSEQTTSSTRNTIYIPLLNEGTDVVRPTTGIRIGENTYRVLATDNYDPNVEDWAFPPGTIVECVTETRSDRGPKQVLVARRRAQ